MPPPVPEGDAPINMIIESTSAEIIGRVARSKVLKPTVVIADIVWKNASRQRVLKSCDCADEGKMTRNAMPIIVIQHVMAMITLEVNVILQYFGYFLRIC